MSGSGAALKGFLKAPREVTGLGCLYVGRIRAQWLWWFKPLTHHPLWLKWLSGQTPPSIVCMAKVWYILSLCATDLRWATHWTVLLTKLPMDLSAIVKKALGGQVILYEKQQSLLRLRWHYRVLVLTVKWLTVFRECGQKQPKITGKSALPFSIVAMCELLKDCILHYNRESCGVWTAQ